MPPMLGHRGRQICLILGDDTGLRLVARVNQIAKGSFSRPLGASGTLDDIPASACAPFRGLTRRHWRHGSPQAYRENGKSDHRGTIWL